MLSVALGVTVLWLLCLLILCLVIRWALIQYATRRSPTLWWVSRDLDKKARAGNDCRAETAFQDTELDATIELVPASCENGLPHTSDANTIRLSADVWNSSNRNTTLKHERIHILQRRDPAAWSRFYKEKWGYTLHTSPPASFPAEFAERIRSNPDTAAVPWAVWQNRYWIVPLYQNTEAPTLLGVDIRIWDSAEQQWTDRMPDEWSAFFCGDGKCPHQWEHPHEIAAELWTADAFHLPAGFFLKEFVPTCMTDRS